MTLTAGLAIYFLIWWVTLFAILPFGVRSQHEAEVAPGTDPGAPVMPRLLTKLVATTIVAGLIFGIIYVVVRWQLFGLDDIPFPARLT